MLVANWPFFVKSRRGDRPPAWPFLSFSFSLLIYLTYDFGRGLGTLALILSPPRQSGLR